MVPESTSARLVRAAITTLTASVVAPSVYLGALGLLSWLADRRPCHGTSTSRPTVLVIVPAHDEAADIAACVTRIFDSDSSGLITRLVVIADNCRDDTADQARAAGAEVLERDDLDSQGKGEALAWACSQPGILEGIDFVEFFDADDHPDAEAIAIAVAHATTSGADVVQVPHISGTPDQTDATAALDTWATILMNRVRPRGLQQLGLPSRLQGGGMLVRADILRDLGWPSRGVSEDFFATLAFLDAGLTIEYCDRSVVWARSARTEASRRVQRVRWESGRLRSLSYCVPLIRTAIRQHSPEHVSMAAYVAVPPLTIHAGLLLLLGVVSLVQPRTRTSVMVATALTGGYMLEGLRLIPDPERRRAALAAAPRFAVWKCRVYRQAIIGFRQAEWVRTPRT